MVLLNNQTIGASGIDRPMDKPDDLYYIKRLSHGVQTSNKTTPLVCKTLDVLSFVNIVLNRMIELLVVCRTYRAKVSMIFNRVMDNIVAM